MTTGIRFIYATLGTTATGTQDGLYATDGTYAGTTLLKAAGTGFLPGYQMAALPNGEVVFGVLYNDPSDPAVSLVQGVQLWETNGTAAGTTMITAFPDAAFGQPNDTSGFSDFVTFGSKVLYELNDGFGNYFLYSTDGTQAGTVELAAPVAANSVGVGDGASTGTKYVYTTLGTTAYGTQDGLYATDGTYAGTTLLKAAGTGFLPGYQMAGLPNGEVVFGVLENNPSDPLGVIQGVQLWETNGTAAGTTMITAFPDAAYGEPNDTSGFSNFVSFGTKILFELNDGFGNEMLYSTDGTAAGTTLLAYPVAANSVGVGDGASTGTKFVYTTLGTTANGTQDGLYATDRTQAGTTLLKAAGTGFLPGYQMAALPNGEVVFGVLENNPSDPLGVIQGVQLWETNGTAAGTTMITAFPDEAFGQPNDTAGLLNFVSVGSTVEFEYADGFGDYFLYSTDGTQAGTVELAAPVAATSIGVGDGASPLCFLIGTRIATPHGPVAVEDLCVGDSVSTASGDTAPVVWLGHRRTASTRHPHPRQVWPVRVAVDAFGRGRPCRDLYLSPNHAVFVLDMLIPIRLLINGTSIVPVPRDEVDYWHLELPRHDLVLAEGLAAESYLDTGDRAQFDNGGGVTRLFPDFSTPSVNLATVWEAFGCAPLVVRGPELDAARALVNAQPAAIASAA